MCVDCVGLCNNRIGVVYELGNKKLYVCGVFCLSICCVISLLFIDLTFCYLGLFLFSEETRRAFKND